MKIEPGTRMPSAITAAILIAGSLFAFWFRAEVVKAIGGQEDYSIWAMDHYFGGITSHYLRLANGLLAGHYTDIAYPPGYAMMLAAGKMVVGDDLQRLRLIQAAIDSFGVWLCFLLLRRAGVGMVLSIVGGLLYAAYPMLAAGSTFLLAEFCSPIILLLLLYLSIVLASSASRTLALGTGLLAGFFSLIRPDMLFFLFFIVLSASHVGGVRRLFPRLLPLLLIGFIVPLVFWGAHNKVQHGDWIITSTGGGAGLWEGLGEIKNEYGYVLNDRKAIEMLASRGLKWHSIEADRYLKAQYVEAWVEHPSFVITVISNRWMNILASVEYPIPSLKLSLSGLSSLLAKYGVLLVLVAVFLKRRNKVALVMILTPPIYALASIGLVHFEPRYVRYVHLGYAFASLLILDYVFREIGRRSRWLASSLTASAFGVVVLATASDSRKVMDKAELDRATAMVVARAKAGELGEGIAFPELQPLVADAKLESRDGALSVTTSSGPTAYQLGTKIDRAARDGVHVSYAGELSAGGFAIGLLSADGIQWLAVKSVLEPGPFRNEIATAITENALPMLVIANQNPSGSSKIRFSELSIRCGGGPCAPARAQRPVEMARFLAFPENLSLSEKQVSELLAGVAIPATSTPAIDKTVTIANGAVTVKGEAPSSFTYVLGLRPEKTRGGRYLVAEGDLFDGGLTLGLLRNNAWAGQVNVTTPGKFKIVMKPEPGEYTAMLAHNVPGNKFNNFKLTKLGWSPEIK